jgi:hypothetical protein
MKKIMLCSCFIMMFLISSVIMAGSASATIPVPGNGTWFYPASLAPVPVLSDIPANARPIGVSLGGIFTVQIGLNQFSGPVDIYGAFVLASNPTKVNVLNPGPGASFTPFTLNQILTAITLGIVPPGANPWMSGVMGPINAQLVSAPISGIPSGTYTAYLLVTPAGSLNNFYLWITLFTIP